jgi:hypothetical protein
MTTIAIWNCADEALGWAEDECSRIEMHRSSETDVVRVPQKITWDGLAAYLRSVDPTIFHFIGHGTDRGELWVHDPGGFARGTDSVLRLLRSAAPSLEGVYLSGCYTARAIPDSLDRHVPSGGWVVGTADAVDDDMAAAFSGRFYDQLLDGVGDPRRAFEDAKAYIEGDFGETSPHRVWIGLSSLPAVPEMARTVLTALRGIFDRPAMQVQMSQEFSFEELESAVLDMGHALGTGEVRSRRDQAIITSLSFPPQWMYEPQIANFVSETRRDLTAIRRGLDQLRVGTGGAARLYGLGDFDKTVSLRTWMRRVNSIDKRRNHILEMMNSLLGASATPLPLIPVSFSREDLRAVGR